METAVRSVNELGDVVRKARKAALLRQVDAARMIGVSPPVLNKLEQGREVWLSKAFAICNALGIEVILRTRGEDSPAKTSVR
jgi:transcriptional regulator with XRE-family HTH domain